MSRTEYRVVYKHKNGNIVTAGSHGWIPDKEVADKLLTYENNWFLENFHENKNCFLETRETDEPDNRVPMEMYNGKLVHNEDHLYWDALDIGDYVDGAVANYIMNCVIPAFFTRQVIQCGEPEDTVEDPNNPNHYRNTYLTLVRVADDVWEFRGYCFKGQTQQPCRTEKIC